MVSFGKDAGFELYPERRWGRGESFGFDEELNYI